MSSTHTEAWQSCRENYTYTNYKAEAFLLENSSTQALSTKKKQRQALPSSIQTGIYSLSQQETQSPDPAPKLSQL